MIIKLSSWLKHNKGQGMVEYALILALVALVVIVSLKALGGKASTAMSTAANDLVTT